MLHYDITANHIHLGAWVKDNAFFYMQSMHGYFSQYGVYQLSDLRKTKIKDSALEKKLAYQFEFPRQYII